MSNVINPVNADGIANLSSDVEDLADEFLAKAESADKNKQRFYDTADRLKEIAEMLDDLSTEYAMEGMAKQ